MILRVNDLEKKTESNKIFLFHGVNDGHKEEILQNIFNPKFGENIIKYFENDILSNINNFYNEILSKSFFEKNKLIIIKEATDKLKNEIEILKEKKLDDVIIILISNILDKKSKLRNLFEKEKNLISVAFYSDNNQTLSAIVRSFFSKRKISVSQ